MSWIPHDPSAFSFTNCTLASGWIAGFLRTRNLPLSDTLELHVNGLENYWESSNATRPKRGELLDWVAKDQNVLPIEAMGSFAVANCANEPYPVLGWQGNSDLAGRGVSFPSKFDV
jgi:hypothetical protein